MKLINENLNKNLEAVIKTSTSVTKREFDACYGIDVKFPTSACSDSFIYKKVTDRDSDFDAIQNLLNNK